MRKGHDGADGKDGLAYSALLKNELLGASIEDLRDSPDDRRALSPVQSPNLYKVNKLDPKKIHFHLAILRTQGCK